LKGPSGSGKTKLAEYLSRLWNQPMHAINCSVDLDAEALLGFKTLTEKSGQTIMEFVPGPVVKAMKEGHFLYIDEINMAKPETLPLINGVLDFRRALTNPFTGEVIVAHPDFRVIAAINEGYIGTVPLNEALKNRFITIEVPYLQGQELYTLLSEQSVLKDEKLLGFFVQLASDLFAQAEMRQMYTFTGARQRLADLGGYFRGCWRRWNSRNFQNWPNNCLRWRRISGWNKCVCGSGREQPVFSENEQDYMAAIFS
jgi:nitric oxide reductase NorQ protein